ncbi:hypothetical protein [Actinomadura sp. 9N407]|uniref:hypothetical protein n=1 Tax=Actinomadura sp. 9N407 TaxID=3375154 RepID=UPI0037926B80
MPPLPRSLTISLATLTCTLAAGSGTAYASADCSTSGRSLLDVLCPVTTYVDTQTRALTGAPDPPAEKPRPPRPGLAAAEPPAGTPRSAKVRTHRPPPSPRGESRTIRRPRPRPRDVAPGPVARPQPEPRYGTFPHGLPVMPQVAPSAPTMRIRAASPAPTAEPLGHTLVGTAAGLAGLICGLNITVLSRFRKARRATDRHFAR